MDWVAAGRKPLEFLKKYRYAVAVLVLGLALMAIPKREEEAPVTEPVQTVKPEVDTEQRLEEILSQIEGAGRVSVLLTQAEGSRTVYQTDENASSDGSLRQETVIVTDTEKAQSGLIRQVDPPAYLGAVIVCQGGDRAEIRLAIVEAVCDATGLTSDRITVLKMK